MKILIAVIAVGIFALILLDVFFPESITTVALNGIAILLGGILAIIVMLKSEETKEV